MHLHNGDAGRATAPGIALCASLALTVVVMRPEHYQGLWPRREPAVPEVDSFDPELARYEEVAR